MSEEIKCIFCGNHSDIIINKLYFLGYRNVGVNERMGWIRNRNQPICYTCYSILEDTNLMMKHKFGDLWADIGLD